ncbi:MAG TPA: mechanosensitive ion channel domain-containing protein [Tepidisphaeraceae bacterium]|jgi:small-conductance mechanosensitive channel|nr:mechanosensitive ion channel domain-containing protein [Tepidisphaeraceae bacterium]
MESIIRFVGPNRALELFGVKLVGINADNGKKFLFTLVLVVLLLLISRLLRNFARGVTQAGERTAFWVRQGIHICTAIVMIVGVASIWFDEPTRLTTAMGLVTAGLAFALQRVVTALAGYVLIMRGSVFNVGDRIVMGGVRGDVIALGFMQTTIMEMGQPPPVQSAPPAMWVKARQYTGRIVTVSNAKVFDEPIYNFTREFPYVWEEMSFPIAYKDDRATVERILLDVAAKHTVKVADLGEPELQELERRYAVKRSSMAPRVYMRMTDNWVDLTLRFIANDHGVRDLKDAMTRDILQALDAANIGIASATFEIVGLPRLQMERARSQ